MIVYPASMTLTTMALLLGMQAKAVTAYQSQQGCYSFHYSLVHPCKPAKRHMEQVRKAMQVCSVGLPAGTVYTHEGIFEPAATEKAV